jgi:hypothetical protein
LAQLLIELLQIKVVNGQGTNGGASGGVFGGKSKGFAFGGSGDDSEEDDKASQEEVKLSPEEQKMTDILNQKRQEVVETLMDRLGPANKSFENCLNAHMVLAELSDNDQLFGKLAENVQRLITHACNIGNVN